MSRITFSDVTKITTAASADFSAAITCPDSRLGAVLFLFVIYNAAAATLNAATIGANAAAGGVPLEQIAQPFANPDMRVFRCVNPPPGAQTIFLDWATPPSINQTGYAVFVFGLDLTNPSTLADTATGSGTSATVSAHTSDGQTVLDFIGDQVATANPTVSGGQTLLAAQHTDCETALSFKVASGPTTTMSYTITNTTWGIAAIALNEAKSAGRSTLA